MGRKAAAGEVASGTRDSRPAKGGGLAQRQVVQRQRAPRGSQSDAGTAASTGAALGIAGTTTQPATDELGTLLAAVQNAADAAARQTATTALTTWCREHLVDRARLRQYLQSNVDNETKTRILGELRAEIGRNEFLLGWSYDGGDPATDDGWERNGDNRGTFPNHYTHAVGTDTLPPLSNGDAQPWCTSFAGHTATRLGFEAAPGSTSTSMFWSGHRLEHWARTGGVLGTARPVTPQDQIVDAGGNSSDIITGPEWNELYRTLTRLQRQRPAGQSDADFLASQQRAVDEFLAHHVTPQPGDMFVHHPKKKPNERIERTNDRDAIANSHTNMVERYDAETRTIYTVGGNEGHAVGGRRIVLTDPAQVHKLAAMVRIGAEFYTGLTRGSTAGTAPGGAATAPGQPATAPGAPAAAQQPASQPAQTEDAVAAPGAMVTGGDLAQGNVVTQLGPELVQAARTINARIAAVLHGSGQLQSGGANATVLEWQRGGTTADASTSDH